MQMTRAFGTPMRIAAGVALVAVAVPLTLHLTKDKLDTTFGKVAQELAAGDEGGVARQSPRTEDKLARRRVDKPVVERRVADAEKKVRKSASKSVTLLSDRAVDRSAAVPAAKPIGHVLATEVDELAAAAPSTPVGVLVGDFDDQRTLPAKEFRDKFGHVADNPVRIANVEPVSTFSLDVDTASYSFVRRMIESGRLPHEDAVRVEEMVNYFPYDYARPESAAEPFRPQVTVIPSPWNPANRLFHIAVEGYELPAAERPRANLVFLIDKSGSMDEPDKLPLVQNALRMLVDELRPDDTVGIVTYASGSGVLLEPTPAADKHRIQQAIAGLTAGGSTAGAAGIEDAYRLAEAHFSKGGANRVILATDGDFNVGLTDPNGLESYIERKRETGVFLSVLGFGQGNYNDALMQTLAQNGNGVAAYIDSIAEARKVLVREVSSSLFTIAKDAKVQIEFNPARVAEYRLIGYETRMLAREDFKNDKVDAGDIGSGHSVTAIYEVTPVGATGGLVDPLRYGTATETDAAPAAAGTEWGFLKMRYKLPNDSVSKLIEVPITATLEPGSIDAASTDVRFSIAVAAFGERLKGGQYLGGFDYAAIAALARSAKGEDRDGYRSELVTLVELANSAQP